MSTDPPPAPDCGPADGASAHALGLLGGLLLDAGSSVTDVRRSLERAAAALPAHLGFSVLPRTVLVSQLSSGETIVVSASGVDLTFLQAARASKLAREVELGAVTASDLPTRIQHLRDTTRPPSSLHHVMGSALVAAGLAVVFRCPWWAVACSVVVGGLVGLVVLALGRLDRSAVVPFVAALVSTTTVGVLASTLDLGPVPLFAVCAPVAVLVPGALITNALLELTDSDIVTGAARLAYGVIVLGLMAAGIAGGAALTGLSIDPGSAALVGEAGSIRADAGAWQALPPVGASWAGVAVLAVGIGLVFGSGPRLTAVNVVAMTGTYAILVALTPHTRSAVATGIAGGALFVVARLIERRSIAVPAAVTFQPAFLLLVPGTVGLVALAAADIDALRGALTTFISLCVGMKLGALSIDSTKPSRGSRATPGW